MTLSAIASGFFLFLIVAGKNGCAGEIRRRIQRRVGLGNYVDKVQGKLSNGGRAWYEHMESQHYSNISEIKYTHGHHLVIVARYRVDD